MHIKSKLNTYELVIGLEVHAQINMRHKLFSAAEVTNNDKPNCSLDFLDLALPGVLPVINMDAVYQCIKTGLAINGTIHRRSTFDRKNYFYPDLPSGYQITQFNTPLVKDGYLDIPTSDSHKRIRIDRIHLEQDAGKLVHAHRNKKTYVDLNRCGVSLMEIVSMPDISSPQEAVSYLKKLRTLLRHIGTSNADMENGSFRCDVNVSLKPLGADRLGTRCEIKNINSFRFVAAAITYEAERQAAILDQNMSVSQETRLFDERQCITISMRRKEDSADYRYFADPDLLPILLEESKINALKSELPAELPDDIEKRYKAQHNLTQKSIDYLLEEESYLRYFEFLVQRHHAKISLTWLTVELCGRLKKQRLTLEQCKVSKENLSSLIDLVEKQAISGAIAKKLLDTMVETGEHPESLMKHQKIEFVSNDTAIEQIINNILDNNKAQVELYRSGKARLFGFFVGETMKATKGSANPAVINSILTKKLQK